MEGTLLSAIVCKSPDAPGKTGAVLYFPSIIWRGAAARYVPSRSIIAMAAAGLRSLAPLMK